MDMNRLTQKSQEALHDAQTKALRFGHTEVDGEHLLLALLEQPDGLVPRLVGQAGADPGRLRAALEADPSAGEFFDGLAQFYRRAYLRWIDGTKRRPDERVKRIVEMVELCRQGVKQRPQP